MYDALYILAATSSTNQTKPVFPLLVVYIIWCWRRTPSPGSTRALDGWAGFLSANLCVVGFWMKRRWALGFLWLAIWAVVIGIQRILAANVQFETDQAVNTFNTISIIGLVLMGWTTGIFALKTPCFAGAATAAHQRQQPPPPPTQADLIVPRAPDGKPVVPRKLTATVVVLIVLSCAITLTIAMFYFRPWEQRRAPKQGAYAIDFDELVSAQASKNRPPVSPAATQSGLNASRSPIDFSPFPDQGSVLTPTEIFRRARPSVVLLTMQDVRGQPTSLGSGFFVGQDVVATNFHVIEGAPSGYAKVLGQTTKLNIKGTVGIDALHDLVLLQVDSSSAPRLSVAIQSSVNIGDPVYAIGNPKGFEGTFSQGLISSIRAFGSDRLLQITAPISPGSSGGPVLDQTGIVIGVSWASIEKGQNLNFAIPSDYLAKLREKNTTLRPLSSGIPRAKALTTLADRMGTGRPSTGIAAENLTYDSFAIQSGEFSFSLHNKLRDNVRGVYGIVVFYDLGGEPIDVYPIQYEGIIPGGTAKRIRGRVDTSVERLNSPYDLSSAFSRLPHPPRPPKGRVEYRILDFDVE